LEDGRTHYPGPLFQAFDFQKKRWVAPSQKPEDPVQKAFQVGDKSRKIPTKNTELRNHNPANNNIFRDRSRRRNIVSENQ